MKFSVTKNGKELDKNLYSYSWNLETKTFSSNEDGLVLDFRYWNGCTFNTGYNCTFNTGYNCIFDTGFYCTFNTGSDCNFDTESSCNFDTVSECTFKTEYDCIFNTGSDCIFDTGSDCTFDTESDCIFDTRSSCTFKTGSNCVVVRRDIFEMIKLKEDQKIKLNGHGILGYKIIEDKKTIIIDDKEIELSLESFNTLKKQLCE